MIRRRGEHGAAISGESSPGNGALVAGKAVKDAPALTSQSRAVQSDDAVSTVAPSGATDADSTEPLWPAKLWRHVPVATLQSLALQSREALKTWDPSGENAADQSTSPQPKFLKQLTWPDLP
eukprot:CAMPEP_0171071306 /NCGR_PEP_ID=MMETSP0766_2-20121228/10251_1 /TAXON_ID=439317 /ORGANISM="Gambierdiscus australes, Strain CAWD 149" /LENGTH=121 /DNA_ID=CAMNT_0011527841 /DNA_START=219 /DNA_END=585 /DNA_ORIENTATION=+